MTVPEAIGLASYPPIDAAPTLADEAAALRRDIVEALYAAGGGHYGGALSVVDVLLTLYRCQLRVDQHAVRHPARDRLILSKGHAAIALYAVQRRLGLHRHALSGYGSFASPLEGHPDMTALSCVDFSTGSLGQGLSVGLGMAVALAPRTARVWVVLGDGECQEGQVWEAAMLAGRLGTDRLHVVIDANRFQEWGFAPEHGNGEPVLQLAEKWHAFGWRVLECNGHDFDALAATLDRATDTQGRPCAVIAHTTKGKGVTVAESDPLRFHCTTVTDDEHRAILEELYR